MHGFLILNKPAGPTSHDVVDRVRRLAGERRVGHAGTLDPFASGVLLVGVGREATREFSKLVGLDKRYRAVLHLGAISDTDDRTGLIKIHDSKFTIQETGIADALKKFTGKIEQIPPMYSAKKIAGKKLYQLAREGKTAERKPSSVEIYSLDLVEAKPRPNLPVLEIHCSSGTYIRALARDIGQELGCGAYLEELERTAIGPFRIEEATKLEDLNKENIEAHLIDIKTAIAKAR